MRKNYEATAAKGRMTTEQVEKAMGLLTPTLDFEALADCDLIIEAVFEQMDVKKDIFARLDKTVKQGAILASNTSYLNIDEIAAVTSRPQDVVGMHFFSPANVMKLLEVVRGAKTAPDVLVTVMGLSKKIRKVAVVAGVCHGFIGNRMLMPRQVEATKLLLEGATPEQIDKVHVEFGMPMGPFQMADLAGVDIGWHRDPNRIENIRDALCAIDRWGQKKGAGFYDYDEKRRPDARRQWSSRSSRISPRSRASSAARSATRRSSSARSTRWSTRARRSSRKAWRSARPTSMSSGSTATAGRSIAAARWPGRTRSASQNIVEGLKRQEERMGSDFSFSKLLLDKAEAERSSRGEAAGSPCCWRSSAARSRPTRRCFW